MLCQILVFPVRTSVLAGIAWFETDRPDGILLIAWAVFFQIVWSSYVVMLAFILLLRRVESFLLRRKAFFGGAKLKKMVGGKLKKRGTLTHLADAK